MRRRGWVAAVSALALAAAVGVGLVVAGLEPDEPVSHRAVLADYLYPVDGDALRAAREEVVTAMVRARSGAKVACLHRQGIEGFDWLPVEQGRSMLRLISGELPALDDLAAHGFDRSDTGRLRDAPAVVRDAVGRCGGGRPDVTRFDQRAGAAAGAWMQTVRGAVERAVQAGGWDEGARCFDGLGAPPEARGGPDVALGWALSLAPQQPDGGADLARATAGCLRGFYADVRRDLQPLRRAALARTAELAQVETLYRTFATP